MDFVTDHILCKCVDMRALLASEPALFNFSLLSDHDLLKLLIDNPDYVDYVDVSKLNSYVRVAIAINTKSNKSLAKKIILTDDDFARITTANYIDLIIKNKKYLSKVKYEDSSVSVKRSVFELYPEWVMDNGLEIPKLTVRCKDNMTTSRSKLDFMDKNFDLFLQGSTSAMFWVNLIKYNSKYETIFLKNINSLQSKTEVRSVFYSYPNIIKEVTDETIVNSKFNSKDWVLLFRCILAKVDNYSLPDELKELLKMDVFQEALSGDITVSTRLKESLKLVANE